MKKYSIWEILVVFIILSTIVISFLAIKGALTSSYHLVDDHEFVRILGDIQNKGFLRTLYRWTADSFTIRFRPLYFVIRVTLTKIFGLNYLAWHLWKASEIIISMFFLYFSARNLKTGKIASFLFAMLTFVGLQMAVWYRLGPQEATGMVFLSIALFFITEHCLYKKSIFNMICICISLFLMTLMKESFVLMLPPMVLLKLILDYYNSDKKLVQVLKKNLPFIIIFALLFTAEMYLIVFKIGTSKIDYAGFSTETDLDTYFKGMEASFYSMPINKPMLLVMMAVGIIMGSNKYKNSKKEKVLLWAALCFVFSIILLQFVLHAKSTMFERYILPMSFAYSFIVTVIATKFIESKKAFYIYLLIVAIICISLFNMSMPSVEEFVQDGKGTNEYLDYIKQNCSKDDTILISMDIERQFSTLTYLRYMGFEKCYMYMDNDTYAITVDAEVYPMDEIKNDINVVIFGPSYNEEYIGNNYPEEKFETKLSNGYVVRIKK